MAYRERCLETLSWELCRVCVDGFQMSAEVECEIWSKLCQESAAGNTLTSQILSYRLPRGGFWGKLLRNVWLFIASM